MTINEIRQEQLAWLLFWWVVLWLVTYALNTPDRRRRKQCRKEEEERGRAQQGEEVPPGPAHTR